MTQEGKGRSMEEKNRPIRDGPGVTHASQTQGIASSGCSLLYTNVFKRFVFNKCDNWLAIINWSTYSYNTATGLLTSITCDDSYLHEVLHSI